MERTDINDIGDLLVSSGIDEKREEEFLSSSYHRSRAQAQANQPRPQTSPFASQQNQQQQHQGPTNFDLMANNFSHIGQRPGNLGQPAKSEEEIAQELEQKHRDAVRAQAVKEQQHLNNPFLWGNSMRFRMEKIANDNGIKIPMQGLYDKIADKGLQDKQTKDLKHKEDGGGSIHLEKAPSLLNKGAPLESIMCLLSIAANERIKSMVEDAYALARNRQMNSDGVVPDEWAELELSPQDSQQQQQLPNGNTPHPPKPQKPPTYNAVAEVLAATAKADRQAEEARLKKRAERKARKEAATTNGSSAGVNGDVVASADGAAAASANGNTPGPSGLVAPEPPKMTKKERERAAKQDVNEETQMKQANSAIQMALGGGKKKYSWLTGGSKGGSTASTPGMGLSRSGTPGVGAGGAKGNTPQSSGGTLGKDGLPPEKFDRKYGVWREDGPGGKDVQLRDWINALEMDGREKKTYASALNKLGRERLLDEPQN